MSSFYRTVSNFIVICDRNGYLDGESNPPSGTFCLSLCNFTAFLSTKDHTSINKTIFNLVVICNKIIFPDGESNPGRRGESAES